MTKATLAIHQGDDYAATVTVANADGSPADLTGYTAQAHMRIGPASDNVVADLGAAITPPNLVNLKISGGETALLFGQYAWDLQLIDSSGIISTILAGVAIVSAEITR